MDSDTQSNEWLLVISFLFTVIQFFNFKAGCPSLKKNYDDFKPLRKSYIIYFANT